MHGVDRPLECGHDLLVLAFEPTHARYQAEAQRPDERACQHEEDQAHRPTARVLSYVDGNVERDQEADDAGSGPGDDAAQRAIDGRGREDGQVEQLAETASCPARRVCRPVRKRDPADDYEPSDRADAP